MDEFAIKTMIEIKNNASDGAKIIKVGNKNFKQKAVRDCHESFRRIN
jgi:hypothetical protein